MTLNLTLTAQLITLSLFFLGTLFGLVKYIARQQEKREDQRFEEMSKREEQRFAALSQQLEKFSADLREEANATLALERQFMRFQADLPREYVRRDDHLRALGTIEAKVDNMALRMERALSSRNQGGTP